jgi:hypothetical protein
VLKAHERIDGSGFLPPSGIETVAQWVGEDLSLDEKASGIWLEKKYLLEQGSDGSVLA